MDIFNTGYIEVPVVAGNPFKNNGKPNIDYSKCKELGIKDPDSVGAGYTFSEGEKHNELTLEDVDVIESMRTYIASRGDYIIVELDEEGNDPTDPEGAVFECRTPLIQLTPAEYKNITSEEGKIFYFNRGTQQNRYITADEDEIKTLRDYIASRVDEEFTEIKE